MLPHGRGALSRRGWLSGVTGAVLAGLWESPAQAAPASTAWKPNDLTLKEIQVSGDKALGRRFVLAAPNHLKAGEKVPLVVLLHGLGETGDEHTGAFAWLERYGLGTAYDRLRRAPIARTSKRKDWTDARLTEVNAALAKKAFAGLCFACPYTPNIHKLPNPTASLEGYAKWIAEVVVPRARKEASVHTDAARTAIDGCSLGGYVAIEVFLRQTSVFGGLGGVQAAFGEHRAATFADKLAAAIQKAGSRSIHLLTSEADPFLKASKALAAALAKKSVACDHRVLPGPHDQPWLREAGTIEMLLWHDRRKKT